MKLFHYFQSFNLCFEYLGFPTASVNTNPDTSLYHAIDARVRYFEEITNRWTIQGSSSQQDGYALDFGKPQKLSSVKLYLISDNKHLQFS